MGTTVGTLRMQSAIADADRPVVAVTEDETLRVLLGNRRLVVVSVYPDTNDGADAGLYRPTFKVELALAA